MTTPPVEVAIARVETQIEALRSDLVRYFSELSNQEDRLRTVENKVERLGERLAIASAAFAGLQILVVAIASWLSQR